ncbi:MAG: flavin reductase family protein [Pseudomonadota bacterium]|nr:flavin reductase family protein [Pseudomonadota bacterium]
MNVMHKSKNFENSASSFEPAPGLRDAMRHLTGGVSVITAGVGDNRTGLTVTTAHSLSTEPPLMVISVNRNSSSYPVIRQHQHFCVNILGAEHRSVAERFSGIGGIKGEDRYVGQSWSKLASGASALDGALANIDCVVEELIERHSHGLFLGRVLSVRLSETPGPQLIYQHGNYGAYYAQRIA